ncbi:MAG: hypothetical protein ACJ77A_15725 [Actinomycetota bacterium]
MSENSRLERAVEDFAPNTGAALAETMRKAKRRRRVRRASVLAVALASSAVTALALVVALGPATSPHPGSSSIPSPTSTKTPTATRTQGTGELVIGETDMPPGFVPATVVSSSPSKLVLEAPPGTIRWTLNGASCGVSQTWIVIPEGGSPGGGGVGGAACPWAPHLSIGAGGELGSNGADFSVVGGHVLPAEGVRVRVQLANGSVTTVEPNHSMWLVVVQRCGDYMGTEIAAVELLDEHGSVIDRKVLPSETKVLPRESGSPPGPWPTWPPC